MGMNEDITLVVLAFQEPCRADLDSFIANGTVETLIATDDNLVLEYSTPRGNVLWGMSREVMMARRAEYRDRGAIHGMMGP
jgi:hypothetical protein